MLPLFLFYFLYRFDVEYFTLKKRLYDSTTDRIV